MFEPLNLVAVSIFIHSLFFIVPSFWTLSSFSFRSYLPTLFLIFSKFYFNSWNVRAYINKCVVLCTREEKHILRSFQNWMERIKMFCQFELRLCWVKSVGNYRFRSFIDRGKLWLLYMCTQIFIINDDFRQQNCKQRIINNNKFN